MHSDFLFLGLFLGAIAFYILMVLVVFSGGGDRFLSSDPSGHPGDLAINPDEGWRLERKIEREGLLWEEEFRLRELGAED